MAEGQPASETGKGRVPSESEIAGNVVRDVERLFKQHAQLARAEVLVSKTRVKRIVMALGAGILVFGYFLGFLLVTGALGLNAAGIPLWGSFGIITLVCGIVVAVCLVGAKLGSKRLQTGGFSRALREFKEDIIWLTDTITRKM